ncbi:MAG: DUF2147 domain-containing protein [Pseudomonadota bacterium]|nr:DUF2147 domain-containing protein [Pseudomonadota bacterium]
MLAMMLAAAALSAATPAARVDGVLGRWITQTRHGIVEITPCGGSICGRLIDSDTIRGDPRSRDDNNKAPAQRHRPLKGLMMLQGFRPDAAKWDGGSVYNPDDGGTYHGTITVVDANTLKVRGCIVWPLCKSQVWKRVG